MGQGVCQVKVFNDQKVQPDTPTFFQLMWSALAKAFCWPWSNKTKIDKKKSEIKKKAILGQIFSDNSILELGEYRPTLGKQRTILYILENLFNLGISGDPMAAIAAGRTGHNGHDRTVPWKQVKALGPRGPIRGSELTMEQPSLG